MSDHRDAMLAAYRSHPGASVQKERRAGHALVVACPFHNEATPSCYLYDDHYHCYGCEAEGSAADFIRCLRYPGESEQKGYAKAYDDLGDRRASWRPARPAPVRSSVDLWRAEVRREVERHEPPTAEEILVMSMARAVYTNALVDGASILARGYAETRGLISMGGLPLHEVGYCGGRQLYRQLAGKDPQGRLIAAAREMGLLFDDGEGERLRGRLILPDLNEIGQCVWMTGRAIPGLLPTETAEQRKYLHLKVAKSLFGAASCRGASVLVVEGQMCVLALRSLGIGAVALSGKTLAARHVPWFYGKHVTLCLDNPQNEADARSLAAAAEKIVGQLEGTAASVDFLSMPAGFKDPSQFIERYGTFPL